jgi:hypothetical protein
MGASAPCRRYGPFPRAGVVRHGRETDGGGVLRPRRGYAEISKHDKAIAYYRKAARWPAYEKRIPATASPARSR